jgi:hypothetical protein
MMVWGLKINFMIFTDFSSFELFQAGDIFYLCTFTGNQDAYSNVLFLREQDDRFSSLISLS